MNTDKKSLYKLLPAYKAYIWGGNKFSEWGKSGPKEKIAEAWELSFRDEGLTQCVKDGRTMPLKNAVSPADLGQSCQGRAEFPLLVKFIDAADNLSVQVHPNDDYARKNHDSPGKTEMWYVVETEPGAGLYVGFNRAETRGSVEKLLKDGTIMAALNFFPVKPGDAFYIPAGTVHAIGKGVTILEVQQNSNLTYRLYDYGRPDAAGNPRELHIERALDVLDYRKYERPADDTAAARKTRPLCACEYFETYELAVDGERDIGYSDSFCHAAVTAGSLTVGGEAAKKGDSFFIPANAAIQVFGKGTLVLSRTGRK